jgi:hypothetical protein
MRLVNVESLHELLIYQVHGESTIIGANNILAKLCLVAGENADAPPSTGNRHVPLLSIRGRPDGGVGKQDVIHRFAL